MTIARAAARWRRTALALLLCAAASNAHADDAAAALEQHVLDRLTYGATEAERARLQALGYPAWLEEQLHPVGLVEDAELERRLEALPPAYTEARDPIWTWPSLWSDHLLRARYSRRQLGEVMTEFWRNHFNAELNHANGGFLGFFTQVAVDGDGDVVLAYWGGTAPMPHFAEPVDGHWSTSAPDSFHPSGMFTSLAIDPSDGSAAVAHYEPLGRGGGNLRLSRRQGGVWKTAVVDGADGDVGAWASLAFSADGRPFIAYHDRGNDRLKLAWWDGYQFQIDDIGSGGLFASLALAGDEPMIAHYDLSEQTIELAHREAGAWTSEPVEFLPPDGIDFDAWPAPARLLSLGVQPATGRPMLAFHDSLRKTLRWAERGESFWQVITIDDTADVGQHPSLAFHPETGEPAIAYYDATDHDLKLAMRDGGTWRRERVDSSRQITGLWASLAFDRAGQPAIAFYNGSVFSAQVARKTAAGWKREQVETIGTFMFQHTVWIREITAAMRQHALGCFSDLLRLSAISPAMMFYLHNDENIATSGNEDWARELLELHTLGVDGGYTQADVETVAAAFTGWGTTRTNDECDVEADGFCYDHSEHDGSAKTIVGVPFEGDAGDASENSMRQGHAVLDMLANHPSTAHFVCGKLISKFVADEPPERLWDECSNVFLMTGGDIKEILRTVLLSDEFLDPSNQRGKIKTPLEFTIGAIRNLEAETDGVGLYGAIDSQGLPLFFYSVPTGYDEKGDYWINPNSLLHRWRFADGLLDGFDGTTVDVVALARAAASTEPLAIVDHLAARLVRGRLDDDQRAALAAVVRGDDPGAIDLTDPAVRIRLNDATQILLASPEYQRQ